MKVLQEPAAVYGASKARLNRAPKTSSRGNEPNAITIRAMQDVRAGKVFYASSAEDLIHQILD